MASRVTLISKTLSPATPYEDKLHTPHDVPPTRHELYLELMQSLHANSGSHTPDPNFLSNIRAAVSQGDVDAVVIHGDPNAEEWKALEGAQAWHLEMTEGSMQAEVCWYEVLKELSRPWPLRSVYICTYNWMTGLWEESDDEDDGEDEDTTGTANLGGSGAKGMLLGD